MRWFVAGCLLLAFPAFAVAEDDAGPLHFRLALGTGGDDLVEGRLLPPAEPDDGVRVVLLDLDGDGEAETRKELRERFDRRAGRNVRDPRVSFDRGEATFTLELDALASGRDALGPGATMVHWSAAAGGLYVRFENAPLVLHADAGAARAAEPFRLGGPFALRVEASTRGPSPTVGVSLAGPNGGGICLVRRDGKDVRPAVTVLADGEAKASGRPGWS
jgi:hypothetical protein